jgi:hypothetical protein
VDSSNEVEIFSDVPGVDAYSDIADDGESRVCAGLEALGYTQSTFFELHLSQGIVPLQRTLLLAQSLQALAPLSFETPGSF